MWQLTPEMTKGWSVAPAVAFSDMWQVIHDTFHMTWDTWLVTSDIWHVTVDTWQVTHDAYQVIHEILLCWAYAGHLTQVTRSVTGDSWHLTLNTWHLSSDTWHQPSDAWPLPIGRVSGTGCCLKTLITQQPEPLTSLIVRCYVSYVKCQVSRVRCHGHVSGVNCQAWPVTLCLSQVRQGNSKSHRPAVSHVSCVTCWCHVSHVQC